MSKGPKISIITACYNAEKTIEQTIKSVLNQTYDNIEYIIVDGASNDGTMNIVNKYQSKIDIIISEPDKGIYDAFNKGGGSATGDYVYYLNADDYFCSSHVVSEMCLYINKDKEKVMYYGGVIILNETNDYLYPVNREKNFINIKNGEMIPHQAVFLKKSIMEENNYFDTQYKIAADYDLITKVFMKYEHLITYVPINVAVFRLGGLSSEFKNRETLIKEYKEIALKQFSVEIHKPLLPSNENLLKMWIENIIFYDKNIFDTFNEEIKNIILWGSGEVSNLLAKQAELKGLQVKSYIDNDLNRTGFKIRGIEINSPQWLKTHAEDYDYIVLGVEGNHDNDIKMQLSKYGIEKNCISWKELLVRL